MGLSRGATDRYSSQREFQYVDMTGLAAGEYLLRAEANPSGHVAESDPTDNLHEQARVLPGVRTSDVAATVQAGRTLSLTLAAEIVAPEVPARAGRGVPPGRTTACHPSAATRACYVWPGNDPVRFAVPARPQHGTLTLDGARATFTPAAGFTGTDRSPTRRPTSAS